MNNTEKLLAYADLLEWQPIETAPRDGAIILGRSEYSGRIGSIQWMEIEDSVLKGHWSGIALATDKPTHWMPIPTGNAGAVIRELVQKLHEISEQQTYDAYADKTGLSLEAQIAVEAIAKAAALVEGE